MSSWQLAAGNKEVSVSLAASVCVGVSIINAIIAILLLPRHTARRFETF